MNRSIILQIIRCVVVLAFTSSGVMWSADDSGPDDSWIQTYYQHPSPGRFVDETTKFQKAGVFHKDGAAGPVAVFFGRLFAANTDKLDAWMKHVETFPERDRVPFVTALHLSDTDEGRRHLERLAQGDGKAAKRAKSLVGKPVPDLKKTRSMPAGVPSLPPETRTTSSW